MLKKLILAAIPVLLAVGNAFAGDDVLSDVAGLKASAITDAAISIDTGLAALDVDALASNAGKEKSTDAIEACFRSYGYNNCGYNYNYYNSCYNSCYNNCYSYCQPTYNYCYQTYYAYRPVCYSVCYPVYSYWGCH